MLLTEIHKVLIEQRTDQFNPTVVPQLFELTTDARPTASRSSSGLTGIFSSCCIDQFF
jgi:hypothetical protein